MRDFSAIDSDARISENVAQRSSEIRRGIAGRLSVFQKIYCDLATAQNANNAFKISVPFRSLFVRKATDSTAVVYFSPNENSIGNIAEAMPLYKNDSFDFGVTLAGGYIWWDAQPGKVIELYVSTEGKMQPGSQISQIAGGLSTSTGSARNSAGLGSAGNAASVLITTSATQILKVDTDRKLATLYFKDDCWIGDASVAVGSRGTFIPAGSVIEDSNTAALYAIVSAGTSSVYGTVEN